jgi:hypothetical protein
VRILRATTIACLIASISAGPATAYQAVAAPAPAAVPPAAATATAGTAAATPLLVDVRAFRRSTYDRVVWEFRGGLPSTRLARYVPELLGDASAEPVRIAGSAILQLTMFQANAHDDSGSTATRRLVLGGGNVIEVVQSGDFEATVSYGVGLAKRQTFRLFTLRSPDRVVLDVRKNYRQATRTVTFLDEPRFAAGTPPFTRRVDRRVPAAAPAHAVLHQLFAGPRPSERRSGLQTVRSEATGFTVLTISASKVARVHLKGGCDSGGSTFTVADLIRPTLKQFSSVRWVKIYDPQGRTEQPTGRRDSIPTCLEP